MSDFSKQIADMLDKELRRNVSVVGGAVLMIQEAVVNGTETVEGVSGLPGTPRDEEKHGKGKGQAASNWFVEVDSASGKTTKDTSKNNLKQAQNDVIVALGRKNPPNYFILFNNLPYIRHLEYGLYPNPPKNPTGKTINGYSTQAKQGMFRLALKEFEHCVKIVNTSKK